MDKVFICGHKNPDTDSVASAASYAYLKNIINGSNFDYQAIRCGNISDQTKYIFERAKADIPPFIKDIYPKVSDCMTKNALFVDEHDPVSKILRYIQEYGIRITPVTDSNGNYKGMAGIYELSELFMRDDRKAKPVFTLSSDTLKRALKAEVLNNGEKTEFQASVVVATMPYESYHSHVEKMDEENTILITGFRKNILGDVFKKNYPAVIIVGLKKEDYEKINIGDFKGWVFASPFDSAQTIRCVEMATPVYKLMTNTEPVSPDDYVDAISDKLRDSGIKSLPVVKDGKLAGVITGTDMLKKKRSRLIMMDHNEMSQAIDGAEVAEIMEIVDHHRLGTIKTINPVHFYAKPIGSTCTLVYQLYKAAGIDIPQKIAMLLLGGILSDTVIMKSPTTTMDDHAAIAELQDICKLDAKQYGVDIFSSTNSLSSKTASQIVGGDFKIFEEHGRKVGISQVETVTLQELDSIKLSLTEELHSVKAQHKLDWMMLLITDIIMEESILITTGFDAAENIFSYKRLSNNSFFLPGILSRKKQLLPEVLRILEEINKN